MRICLTGGGGFVGSHVLLDLITKRHDVLVIDNFSTTSGVSLEQVRSLSSGHFRTAVSNICNLPELVSLFQEFKPDCVVHCAGLKSVGESKSFPLRYYRENISGTVNVLTAMEKSNCKTIVFSSSATVYGELQYLPCDENHPLRPNNVYAQTKFFSERIIEDWVKVDASRSVAFLRYFNPIGAHNSGGLGESPLGTPNNLMPYIADVAFGSREKLYIFGDDYDTHDGTGVRDYIHISDLSLGHLAAINFLSSNTGSHVFNLGSGKGYSVMEVIRAFEAASSRAVPYDISPRRPGDVAISYAEVSKANRLLHWKAKLGLKEMCTDVWRWRSSGLCGDSR